MRYLHLHFTLALVVPLALAFTARAEPVDLELVLAVDISGSVDEEESELQRAGYVAAVADPSVIGAIQSGRRGRIALAYVEWAGDHFRTTLIDWTVIGGFGAFIVVANTYNDFARAIRRKMILEIAGIIPEPAARLIPAASGFHPPCDIGEIIRDSRESF